MKPIWEHPYVKKTRTCWLWMGAKNRKGYGMVSKVQYEGMQYVHHIAYKQKEGLDPVGFLVCHHCDIPNCLNPKHLFLGDNFSNQQDCVIKGRQWNVRKKFCYRGHPFFGKNLRFDRRGHRVCVTCAVANCRRNRAKSK